MRPPRPLVPPPDYRRLLRRYLQHVINVEGSPMLHTHFDRERGRTFLGSRGAQDLADLLKLLDTECPE